MEVWQLAAGRAAPPPLDRRRWLHHWRSDRCRSRRSDRCLWRGDRRRRGNILCKSTRRIVCSRRDTVRAVAGAGRSTRTRSARSKIDRADGAASLFRYSARHSPPTPHRRGIFDTRKHVHRSISRRFYIACGNGDRPLLSCTAPTSPTRLSFLPRIPCS